MEKFLRDVLYFSLQEESLEWDEWDMKGNGSPGLTKIEAVLCQKAMRM